VSYRESKTNKKKSNFMIMLLLYFTEDDIYYQCSCVHQRESIDHRNVLKADNDSFLFQIFIRLLVFRHLQSENFGYLEQLLQKHVNEVLLLQ